MSIPLRLLDYYLRSRGWVPIQNRNPYIQVFKSPEDDQFRRASLILPVSEEFEDSNTRVDEAVSTVARFLGVPRNDLITSIRGWNSDFLCVRIGHRNYNIDSIAFPLAATIVDQIRSFLGYAAESEVEPRRFFVRSKSTASEFVGRCAFGHTFAGSFGLKIECPLRTAEQVSIPDIPKDPPFERKVMNRIAKTYDLIKTASEREDPQIIVDSYQYGPNANMLRALEGVYESLKDLTIEYSAILSPEFEPEIPNVSTTLPFDGRSYRVVSAAADILEEEEVLDETAILSYVHTLKSDVPLSVSDQDSFDHVITLDWEKQRGVYVRIRVNLPADEYRLACDAHKHGKQVHVRGTPRKHGKFWFLENSRDFKIWV